MADDFEVKSTGTRIKGEKAAEQAERLAKISAKKTQDRKAAAQAEEAERKAIEEEERLRAEAEAARKAEEEATAEEARKLADSRREAAEKIGSAALSVGGAIAGTAAESVRKGELKISHKTLFFGLAAIAIIALLLFLAWPRLSEMLFPAPEPQTTVAAELSEQSVMTNTSAEIGQAILGEARQKSELVVWEQDVQVDSEISQALANLPIFKKTKRVRSFGTGVFTVDMSQVGEASVNVDQQTRTVHLTIPRTQLQYVTKDLEKTEFEDTQHAILGFGDVKLTQEQQNILEQSIDDAMRAELQTAECFADADEAALLVVYDVYQPIVSQIDPTYTFEVSFEADRQA